MRVHVVDNASADGTVEMVRREFSSVELVSLNHNAGFAAANNLILRASEAPFVLLLNPDTEVREGALDHLLRMLEERLDVGMIGCRLVQLDGTFDHAAKRSFPTPVAALAHFSGVGRLPMAGTWLAQYRAPELGEMDVGEVDAVNGAFMLVRDRALREVGPLDEGYWLYMEDLDWCRRFHDRGWKVLYDGRVSVTHAKGGCSGKHRALRQNIAFHRGMARFYRKFYARGRPLTAAAVYCGIGLKMAVSVTRSWVARRGG